MPQFTVSTDSRLSIHDVTDRVREAVSDAFDAQSSSSPSPSTSTETVCTVFVDHTTAGLVVNESEPRLLRDFEAFLHDVVADEGWEHDALDGNADSHLRTLLLSNSVSVPVVDGDLALGRWQSVLLVDCDGPRERRLRVVCG